MRRIFAGALALLAAITISGAAMAAGQVAARAPQSALYSAFNDNHAKGLVVVENPRNSETASKIHVALGGLLPGHRYRLIVSSDGCETPLPRADRIMAEWTRADGDGAIFRTSIVDGADLADWRQARSTRLMEEEGIWYFCRTVQHVDLATTAEPDGSYAKFADGARRGLTVDTLGGNDQISFRAALTGLVPGKRYRLVYSPLTCKQSLEGDPDQPIVVGSFRANGDGMAFFNRTETVDNDEKIRSVRTESVGINETISCANARSFIE